MYGAVLETDFTFATPGPATERAPEVRFTCTTGPAMDLGSQTLVDAQGRRDDGDADFAFFRGAEGDVVRITGATDFAVGDHHIACRLIDARHRYLVEIALLGMVFALWLERRDVPTLHASAVAIGGRAVGFLATKGAGKTSLAAACLQAGHELHADDLLALVMSSDVVGAERGWPALRLWPDQVRHFVGDIGVRSTVHPDYDKVRVVVGDEFGRFSAGAVPLARLYVPARCEDPRTPVGITPLRPRDAVMALVRHSFLPREVQRFGLQARRLQHLAAVLDDVRVAELRYPSGLDRLPEVVAAIEQDLEAP